MHEPVIFIDSQKARELDISIDLPKIYYHPSGYQRTSKKPYDVSHNAGFDFTLAEVQEWLERQLLHLIHKPRPKYIPCASFNKITVPMKVIQADLCYMPHDKVGNKIYKYALTCVDIASRTKWVCPLTERDSDSVAKGFIKLFKFHNFPLKQLEILQIDFGSEFYGKCEESMIKYNSSKPRYGPMGYDEIRLTYSDSVLYLLNPGELEGGRKRVTDCNWSPQIYYIKESLVQKNQPVLYWIEDIDGNGPKRSF
ncbi:hypothetical protein Glove_132g62 [Diversispora epigaea]|uniref:Integrase catalytic domain-containing protein n=1 Tax=Diversispora epigaea TaxID=1348612 RepID=A0A397IXL5_9GLOM|nr:hypothetical protein Glove_132g62 [Diversispora epigaea]